MPRRACFSALILFVVLASPLTAQFRGLRMPPRTWVSAWASLYTTVDAVYDPGTDTGWRFEDNVFGVGLGVHRQVTPGIMLGVEGSWARSELEMHSTEGVERPGDADLVNVRATGRLQSAGATAVNLYLMGGIGWFAYLVPEPAANAWDFSLNTGAGIEYRFRRELAGFFEWDRIWAYHEKGEIDGDNTGRHGVLRFGLRRGF